MQEQPASSRRGPGTALLALALLGAAAGCTRENPVLLVVRAADGGDPFLPPAAATHARVTVEDDATVPVTVATTASGAFTLRVTPANPGQSSRIVLEALRAGLVTGSGATPPVPWESAGGVSLPIFVQRRDTLALVPEGMAVARRSPHLVPLGTGFVAALGGATDNAPIDVYNLLYLRQVQDASVIDAAFDAEASVVPLSGQRVLVVRGCTAVRWDATTNVVATADPGPPRERCGITGSTALWEPFAQGGGLLLGGRDASGPVDRVDAIDASGAWGVAPALAVPREHPAAVRLGAFTALVAGGQSTGSFLERYQRSGRALAVSTGDATLDGRRGAALVDVGDGAVLALGGTEGAGGTPAAQDLVLDTRCLEGGCPVLLGQRALLQVRRSGASAALAEGGQVLVIAGEAAGTAVTQAEVVDATTPRAPRGVGPAGELPGTGLSLVTLVTGSVLVAGGGGREAWFFRH